MLINLALYVMELELLGGSILVLHAASHRYGTSPLLVGLGVLTALLHVAAPLSPYIQVSPQFSIPMSSDVFVPVILLGVLLLYVMNGTLPARQAIYTVMGTTVVVFLARLALSAHLSLEGGGNLAGLPSDSPLLIPNPRVMIGSLVAFGADLYTIIIVYQFLINSIRRCPLWLAGAAALLTGLWVDAVLYHLLVNVGMPDFVPFATNDLLGKTLAAVLIVPLIVGYWLWATRRQPLSESQRPTLDVLLKSTADIQAALQRSTAELHQTENIYRQLTENIDEVFWLSDVHSLENYYISPTYEKVWGRPVEDLYENQALLVDTVLAEDRERFVQQRTRWQNNDFKDVEYRILRPDGGFRWIRHRVFPIHDESGAIYRLAGVAADITQLKQAEQHQIDLALEQERNRLMRDSISDISHDLKTPLAIITTKVDLIKRSAGDLTKQHAHLNELQFQAHRLSKMIDDLLTLSRLENSKALTYQLTDINALIETLRQDYTSLAETRRLQMVLDLQERIPTIPVDRIDIKRALSNLIENALFYTDAGGTITLRTRFDEHSLVVDVSDTGIGISEDTLPHIFDRFYRVNRQRKTEKGGTGLGLAIVKKVVEMHGGEIKVISQSGKGTTFTVLLPTIWPRSEAM